MSNEEMISPKKYSLLLILLLHLSILNAQIAPQMLTFHNINNVSIEKMDNDADNHLIIGGLYDGTLEVGSTTLDSKGENDIFIAKRSGDKLVWVQDFGSSGQDELLALTTDLANNIYVVGIYLGSIVVGETVLTPATGVRGLFLLKLSPLGDVIWVKDVNSSGEQVITEVVVDANFQIYACGYFGGLFLNDSIEMTAVAENDMMLLQFSESGILEQAYQAGVSGNIRAASLSLNTDENLVNVSGIYKGIVDFGDTNIQTNTNDFDLFVSQFNTDLEVQWARKAGGVFEENNAKILTDEMDNVFVLGDFQGVLKLDETLEITSVGVQDNNLYILKYDKNGNPLFARSLGSTNFDFATDATWSNTNQIAMTGYYQSSISIDNFTLNTSGNLSTYTVGISSENGAVEWLEGLDGTDLVIANTLVDLDGQLVIGGGFNSSLSYQNEMIESVGLFDGFIQYFDSVLTPLESVLEDNTISIYPNPTKDFVYVKNKKGYRYEVDLYTISGEFVKSYINPTSIDLSSNQNGIYMLHIRNNKGQNEKRKIIVQKDR